MKEEIDAKNKYSIEAQMAEASVIRLAHYKELGLNTEEEIREYHVQNVKKELLDSVMYYHERITTIQEHLLKEGIYSSPDKCFEYAQFLYARKQADDHAAARSSELSIIEQAIGGVSETITHHAPDEGFR